MSSRLLASVLALFFGGAALATLSVSKLRCEYLDNPLGIDATKPRFYWTLSSGERNQMQIAYRIRVASSPELLKLGTGDLWDSGRVSSSETIHIEYGGKALRSRQQAWWNVQAWDRAGKATLSKPALFSVGLLSKADWKAKWIGVPAASKPSLDTRGAKWVWFPEGEPQKDAPSGDRWFRKSFDLPGGKLEGALGVAADDSYEVWLNGNRLGDGSGWGTFGVFSLGGAIKAGSNEILIRAHNERGPAGLLVVGQASSGPTDPRMKRPTVMVRLSSGSGWESSADREVWGPAKELADINAAPYGKTALRDDPQPSPFLMKTFSVSSPIHRATIYASAKGLYELYIDRKKVGKSLFTPGWTDYNKRIQYQTYDVTDAVKTGNHSLGIILGDGWYCGNVAWAGRQNYGPKPMGLVQLEIEYLNGARQIIGTDDTWMANTGPIRSNDLLMGESYDARQELALWTGRTTGPAQAWFQPDVQPLGPVPLVAQRSETCQVLATLKPQKLTEPKPGVFVFDLGQNMVGHVRLRVQGPAGTTITIRHAEMLNPDGTLYTTNLRRALATDSYTLRGGAAEVWEPRFTFHGFRYVELTGFPGKPDFDAVTGIVVGSAIPQTGWFSTSNPLVNQLQHNIFWGQRSNYFEVPTDCPQRDERLGWMGDAQIFVKTGTFNNDIAGFMTKWTQDVEDAQSKEGSFPNVSPKIGVGDDGAPAWGDAGVIVPWTIFSVYGDKRLLAERYDSMKEWVEFVDKHNPDHIWTKRADSNFGDWLNVNDDTPRDVVATAYFAHSARILGDTAAFLGKAGDAHEFYELTEEIHDAFAKAFVGDDGHIKGDTQSAYVLALQFELVPPPLVPKAVDRLVELIAKRNYHLTTGFLGCGYLNEVLTRYGHTDLAYRLLMNQDYPSWLYPVVNGATTIWERWDGWTQDKGFQDPGMNSFNHYSFGAIGNWMYRNVAGLNTENLVQYRIVRFTPAMGGGLTSAAATYDSVRGRIKCSWAIRSGRFLLDVTVPPNCTGYVTLPGPLAGTTESARPLEMGKRGIVSMDESERKIVVAGGTYHFSSAAP